jgi:hypothetical protein
VYPVVDGLRDLNSGSAGFAGCWYGIAGFVQGVDQYGVYLFRGRYRV